MTRNRRLLVRRMAVFIVCAAAVALAAWNEATISPRSTASGSVRVASPDIDVERFGTESVDLDALMRTALQRHPELQLVRTGDRRLDVRGDGPEAAAVVSRVLGRLADGVIEAQLEAGIPDEQFLRLRLSVGTTEQLSPGRGGPAGNDAQSVIGTLVLEESRAIANPISDVSVGARLLQVVASSDVGEAAIAQSLRGGDEHTVSPTPGRDAEGIMDITVTSATSEHALSGFDAVVEFLEGELRERQTTAGVPPREQYIIEVIAQPLEPQPVSSSPALSTIILLLVGFLLALALHRTLRPNGRTHGASGEGDAPRAEVPGGAEASEQHQQASGPGAAFVAATNHVDRHRRKRDA